MARINFVLTTIVLLVFLGQTSAYDKCKNHKCQNGGRCVENINPYERELVPVCLCKPSFTGPFCESAISDTADASNCPGFYMTVEGKAKCICRPGAKGPHCFEDSDNLRACMATAPCTMDPVTYELKCNCGNGKKLRFGGNAAASKCKDCPPNKQCIPQKDGGYQCACPKGMVGDYCEYADPCIDLPADACGHGVCDSTVTGIAVCACEAGFQGDNCQDDIDECDDNPCNDGEMCFNSPGSYKCVVAAMYVQERQVPRDDTEVFLRVCSDVALMILAILALYMIYQACSTGATEYAIYRGRW
uniref:EGF-like domain-containing protein n=1 Tax=Panagrellus redivivus TaxID=6233 RepID=A0A7E4ZZG7_PANRE